MFGLFSKAYSDITVSEAHAREDVVIVDVREKSELAALPPMKGAIHVPLGQVLDGADIPGVSPSDPVLVVCRSGIRSSKAAKALTKRGFTDVYNMSGGMMAWSQAGLPTVQR